MRRPALPSPASTLPRSKPGRLAYSKQSVPPYLSPASTSPGASRDGLPTSSPTWRPTYVKRPALSPAATAPGASRDGLPTSSRGIYRSVGWREKSEREFGGVTLQGEAKREAPVRTEPHSTKTTESNHELNSNSVTDVLTHKCYRCPDCALRNAERGTPNAEIFPRQSACGLLSCLPELLCLGSERNYMLSRCWKSSASAKSRR